MCRYEVLITNDIFMRNNTIARIENDLIFSGKYQLTAKEQKIVLFLVSKLNPMSELNFSHIDIKIKDLESLLSNKKNGSFVKEINDLMERLNTKQISFISSITHQGKILRGYVSWFSLIIPILEDGEAGFRFLFNPSLKPFLLDLKGYTQIDYLEILPLKSSFSIRMFQIFKAHSNKMAKYQKRFKLKYGLDDLKELLEVSDKYNDYRNLRKKVLTPMEKEINEHTSLNLKYIPIRENRKITAIQFEFWETGTKSDPSSNSKKLGRNQLSFAQERGFKQLVKYGINEGIALEMLSKIKGSEIKGFEDWYFDEVISIFETKTDAKDVAEKAGILVNWFLKKKVFDQGDMFAKVMETLAARKKKLRTDNLDAWDNRQLAKNLTAAAFRKYNNKLS